jgi:AcrR family transcriptional regulator
MTGDAEQTKARILEAAIVEFTRHGFHGARVAQIARRAEVNVALIYRYFESKEQLFTTLLDRITDHAQPGRRAALGGERIPSSAEDVGALLRWSWDILQEHRDLIKLILSESLRDEARSDLAIDLLYEAVLDRVPPEMGARRDPEAVQMLTAVCFYGLLPSLTFMVYWEKWAARLGVEPERLRDEFFVLAEEMYGRLLSERIDPEPERKD